MLFRSTVSAGFLLLLGFANLRTLRRTWRALRAVRAGAAVTDDPGVLLGGTLARLLRALFTTVSSSWRLYPVGLLFGLGFDTATEIGILGISASQAAHGLSSWAVLAFPALFTAGMTLIDAADSMLMTGAYGWAFSQPIRKLWYNLTVTAASVAVAVFIGGIEALGLVGDKLKLRGGFWDAVGAANDNLSTFGYAVVAIFIASWVLSALLYKLGRFEAPAV